MTDVALKEFLEAKIDALRVEMKQQREADWRALDLARENFQLRVDTFRWTAGILIAALLLIVTFLGLRR